MDSHTLTHVLLLLLILWFPHIYRVDFVLRRPSCCILSLQSVRQIHAILTRVFLIMPQFALGDSLVQLSYNQFVSGVFARFGVDNYQNPFSFNMLGWHMVALGIVGAVLFLLVLLLESRGCRRRRYTKTPT